MEERAPSKEEIQELINMGIDPSKWSDIVKVLKLLSKYNINLSLKDLI